MNLLIIIGFGGHGRVIKEIVDGLPDYQVIGYMDQSPSCHETSIPYLGCDQDIDKMMQEYPNASYVIGVGDTFIRRKLISLYEPFNLSYATIVSNQAIKAESAVIGEGSVVFRGAIINSYASLGCHSIINSGAIIEHDCILGNNVHIGPRAALGGSVHIEDDVFLGIGACVIPGVRIKQKAIIGAGSAVTKNVEADTVVVGVPARMIKRRT